MRIVSNSMATNFETLYRGRSWCTFKEMIPSTTALSLLLRCSYRYFPRSRVNAISEYFFSCVPAMAERYIRSRRGVVSQELRFLQGEDFTGLRRIVVVGSGAVPFSGVAFSQDLGLPVTLIDRSSLACALSKRWIARRREENCTIIRGDGENFPRYDDCLVLISHYVEKKNAILSQILRTGSGRRLVLLRKHREEVIRREGWSERQIPLDYPELITLVLQQGRTDDVAPQGGLCETLR